MPAWQSPSWWLCYAFALYLIRMKPLFIAFILAVRAFMDSLPAVFVAWARDRRIPQAWSSELSMEAEAEHRDRTPDLVIARIVDVLKVEGSEEPAPQMRGIEALEDFLRAVGEAIVTQ